VDVPAGTAARTAAALLAAVLLAGCSSSADEPAARPSAAPSAAPSTVPTPSPVGSPSPAVPAGDATYVALGDSVAAGVGADDPARAGYVPVLAALRSARLGCAGAAPADGCPVRVRNLAVPGATTETLLRDQLPTAVDLLRAGDVRTVTVTVGGNDVFVPVLRSCAQAPEAPECAAAVRSALATVDAGVDRLLVELTAAGPGATVAVMTYYDPLPACRLAPLQPLAERVLEGTGAEDGLNDVLRARAAEHGAVVVETRERLSVPEDLVGGLDCLHPSTSGHARIAEAFAEALPG
jgi:lysophospholipase L1-like esterase